MALPLGMLADAVGGRGTFVTQGLIAGAAIVYLGLTNRRHTFRRPADAPASAGHH